LTITASPWPPPSRSPRSRSRRRGAQLVHERAEDARAGRADRVADRDRAAVDVHAVLVEVEHPHRVQGHGGERLVDLPQVDVARLQPRLVERLLGRVGGRAREVREVVGHRRPGR
jgi:hypothetical protein